MPVCPGCQDTKQLRYSVHHAMLHDPQRVRICRGCWMFTRRHFGMDLHQPHLRCCGAGSQKADPAKCAERLATFQLPAGTTFRDALTDEVVRLARERVLAAAAGRVGGGRIGRHRKPAGRANGATVDTKPDVKPDIKPACASKRPRPVARDTLPRTAPKRARAKAPHGCGTRALVKAGTTSGLVKPEPLADVKAEQTVVKPDPSVCSDASFDVGSLKPDPGHRGCSSSGTWYDSVSTGGMWDTYGLGAGSSVDLKPSETGSGEVGGMFDSTYGASGSSSCDDELDNPLETPASEWYEQEDVPASSSGPTDTFLQALVLTLDSAQSGEAGAADELLGDLSTSELDEMFTSSSPSSSGHRRPPAPTTSADLDVALASIDSSAFTFPAALGDMGCASALEAGGQIGLGVPGEMTDAATSQLVAPDDMFAAWGSVPVPADSDLLACAWVSAKAPGARPDGTACA